LVMSRLLNEDASEGGAIRSTRPTSTASIPCRFQDTRRAEPVLARFSETRVATAGSQRKAPWLTSLEMPGKSRLPLSGRAGLPSRKAGRADKAGTADPAVFPLGI